MVVGTERHIQAEYQDNVTTAIEVAVTGEIIAIDEVAVVDGNTVDGEDTVAGEDAATIKDPHLSVSFADSELLKENDDEDIQLRRSHGALL